MLVLQKLTLQEPEQIQTYVRVLITRGQTSYCVSSGHRVEVVGTKVLWCSPQ